MTKKRAERLTGYEVRELPPERGLYTVGAFEGERLVVKAVGRADFIAFQALVNGVYFFNSRKAMEQHGCAAHGADPAGAWRFITASIVRMGGRTGSRIWSPSAGTAIK
jgi:hypothetical protein